MLLCLRVAAENVAAVSAMRQALGCLRSGTGRRYNSNAAATGDNAGPTEAHAVVNQAEAAAADASPPSDAGAAGAGGPTALQSVKQGEVLVKEKVDRNEGKPWWRRQSWNYEHGPAGTEFRKMTSLGRFPYENSYFGDEYRNHAVMEARGAARNFPMPDPMEMRGRYGTISWEGKAMNAAIEMYNQGKMIYLWYAAIGCGIMWIVNYMNHVDTVPLPEQIAPLDTQGTGTSQVARFMLPDFKCFDVGAVDRDGYLKKYTASAFSCWGFWPYRKFAGTYNVNYYCRAYHLHFRRRIEPGEYFGDYRLVERDRTQALLQSDLFGTIAHVRAEVDDDGVLTLQLSTILPADHWTQSYSGTFVGDNVITPVAKFANTMLTRHWMTSSCNFFLRHHCSEVYVKPVQAAQVSSHLDVFA